MNWLLVIVLLIILFSAIRGCCKGFLRVLFSLVSVIVLIVLVSYATPHVTGFIQEHTQLDQKIAERISDKMQTSTEATMENAADTQQKGLEDAGIYLPESIQKVLIKEGVSTVESTVSQSGVYEKTGQWMAGVIISVLAFLIALLLGILIVWMIGRATDVVNHIPVIGGINRFLGFFAGGFQGIIAVWLLFLIISIMSGTDAGGVLAEHVEENTFLSFLYQHNLVLNILSHMLGGI